MEASTVTRAAAALTLGLTAAAFVTTGGLAAVGAAAALGFIPGLMKAARKALGGLSKTEKAAETVADVERTVEKIVREIGDAKLLGTARDNLLTSTQDEKLKRLIDRMYRRNASIGSGSTADAVRFELKTGELLSPKGHTQKAKEMISALQSRINSGELSPNDLLAAKHLQRDLFEALNGK